MAFAVDEADTLPAASVALTVYVWVPVSVSALSVNVVVVIGPDTDTPPRKTSNETTPEPPVPPSAGAVQLRVGFWFVGVVPLSPLGAFGMVVSYWTETPLEAGPSPELSTAVTV